jgi:CheY-like chemotaxis protein
MIPTSELDQTPVDRPRVVFAHSEARYLARAEEEFGRRGWEVFPAGSGPQVRRLVRRVRPQLVVLEAELPEESGWLTCAKLTREQPKLAVVLVSGLVGSWEESFGRFVGAARVVERRRGLAGVLPAVEGTAAGVGITGGPEVGQQG